MGNPNPIPNRAVKVATAKDGIGWVDFSRATARLKIMVFATWAPGSI
jgi:hypothetical protein